MFKKIISIREQCDVRPFQIDFSLRLLTDEIKIELERARAQIGGLKLKLEPTAYKITTKAYYS